MANIQDLKARVSDASTVARCKLEDRIRKSEGQQDAVLRKVFESVIIDKLVDPAAMDFTYLNGGLCLVLSGSGPLLVQPSPIHSHAMGQMADVSGLTRTFMRRLADSSERWMHDLLEYNFRELFNQSQFKDRKGMPKRYLVRMVGSDVRGFVSQNFNRKLQTAPLLRSFIENNRMHGAGPVETTATDVRVRVKYMLPFVFEPVEGEFVAFGATFGNSDFGAGRLSVSGTVQRVSSGTTAVLSDKYSRTHLGSVIQDSDIEMSRETADKELDTVRSAIGDTINGLLGVEAIERNIKLIQIAHEKEIPWYKLKQKIGTLLGPEDYKLLEHMLYGGAAIIDLPPINTSESDDGKSPTAWWASNAVSSFAASTDDPDRKSELQTLAGQLMAG